MIHVDFIDRARSIATVPTVCMHCDDPTCAEVCPADAIKKTEDGIVQSALKPRCVAYSRKCTHLSCAVYFAREKGRLECPCHEGYFSVEDGSVLQGPPPRPLPRVTVERRGEELIATAVHVRPEQRPA